MIKYLTIVVLVCFTLATYAQQTKYNCSVRSAIPLRERLLKYPFSKAKKTMLVSFKDTINYLPFVNDTVCLSKLTETKVLSGVQVDSLTYLLYNVGVKGNTFKYTSLYCYAPKNAILFLDSRGRAFAFIEIDFDCRKVRYSSQHVEHGIFCNDKFQMLKTFFARAGIQYGTGVH